MNVNLISFEYNFMIYVWNSFLSLDDYVFTFFDKKGAHLIEFLFEIFEELDDTLGERFVCKRVSIFFVGWIRDKFFEAIHCITVVYDLS